MDSAAAGGAGVVNGIAAAARTTGQEGQGGDMGRGNEIWWQF